MEPQGSSLGAPGRTRLGNSVLSATSDWVIYDGAERYPARGGRVRDPAPQPPGRLAGGNTKKDIDPSTRPLRCLTISDRRPMMTRREALGLLGSMSAATVLAARSSAAAAVAARSGTLAPQGDAAPPL